MASAQSADRPQFALPLDCAAHECFLQNMVDRITGRGVQDGWCGRASYDGHKGTDIRVRDMVTMRAGVPVLAMAGGTVARLRDGEPDTLTRSAEEARRLATTNRACGNGVVVDHGARWGGGWTTQFCHLAKGSVRVRRGETVEAGTPIGAMGVSGLSAFPHIHVTVRRAGAVIDPMTGRDAAAPCLTSRSLDASLWNAEAREVLGAGPERIVAAGFAAAPVADTAVIDGNVARPRVGAPLVAYAHLANMAKGDRIRITLNGPAGFDVEQLTKPLDAPKATFTAYAGKRGAPAGDYRASVIWLRGNTIIAQRDDLRLSLK